MDDEKKESKSKNAPITLIFVALLCVAGGFWGGMQYQKTKLKNFTPGQFQNGVRPGGMSVRDGNFQGARPVSGEISSIEDNLITVNLQDGSSKIVIFSDSTNITKTSDGSKEDLKVGETIMVTGTEGTDGTVTAQVISIGENIFLQR